MLRYWNVQLNPHSSRALSYLFSENDLLQPGVVKYLAKTYEDFFLLHHVSLYYHQPAPRINNFQTFVKHLSAHPELLDAKLRKAFIEHARQIFRIINDLPTSLTQHLKNIEIVGDPHPDGYIKLKLTYRTRHQQIVYQATQPAEVVLHQILRDYFPALGSSVPSPQEIQSRLWQRDFIAPRLRAKSVQQIEKFYDLLGQSIPLFIALRALDLNAENMICCLPSPIFFDTECLFAPELLDISYMLDSTGILYVSDFDNHSTILGGLFSNTSYTQPVLSGHANAPLIKWTVPSQQKFANRPILDNRSILPWKHTDNLLCGYDNGAKLVLHRRQQLLNHLRDHPVTIRLLLRPTRTYVVIFRRYTFPKTYQQPSQQINRLITQELASATMLTNCKPNRRLVEYEVSCIRRGLIPVYFVHTDSTAITCSSGAIVAHLPRSPFDELQSHLAQIDKILPAERTRLKRGLISAKQLYRDTMPDWSGKIKKKPPRNHRGG